MIADIVLIQLTSNHQGDKLIAGGLGHDTGVDICAVTKNRHAVTDLKDLTHLMGNVDNADSTLRQIMHDAE